MRALRSRDQQPPEPEAALEHYRGIVIRRTRLPRGDVVATLISGQGKFKVVARSGSRSPRGRLLSLFNDVSIVGTLPPGRDLISVREVSLEGALTSLIDPLRFAGASLLCELAAELVPEGEAAGPWTSHAFELLASGLRGCNRSPDPAHVTWVMAWKLLVHAGFPLRIPLEGEPLRGVWADPVAFTQLETAQRRTAREALLLPAASPQTQWRMWRALRAHVNDQVGSLSSWSVLWPMLEVELGPFRTSPAPSRSSRESAPIESAPIESAPIESAPAESAPTE